MSGDSVRRAYVQLHNQRWEVGRGLVVGRRNQQPEAESGRMQAAAEPHGGRQCARRVWGRGTYSVVWVR